MATLVPNDSTFDFGARGTPYARTFTITNGGNGVLNISSVDVTGDRFSVQTALSQSSLAPAQSGTFVLLFTPSGVGAATGGLSLVNDSSVSPYEVVLTGESLSVGLPLLEISFNYNAYPDSGLTADVFTSVDTGISLQGYVQNEGTASLEVSLMTLTGDPEFDFVINPAPVSIAASDSELFQINFQAASPGIYTAQLSITSNNAVSPFLLNISVDVS